MKGVWIKPSNSNVAVVFVHGILSDGESCWTNHNGCYWPELLGKEPGLESLGIYVFTYKTGFFSGSFRVGNAVDSLKERMRMDQVLEADHLIFVCHSMGGIVVRKFLVERAVELIEAQKRIGLFLIASPSLGSTYANLLSPLARLLGNAQAGTLRFVRGNEWLADLNKEFTNLKESRSLPMQGKELVEDKFLFLPAFFRRQLVEPFAGAVNFGESYKVPNSDHSSISKPENADSEQHRLLCEFIRSFLANDTEGNAVERGEKPKLSTKSPRLLLEDRRLPPNPSNRFYFGSRQQQFIGRQAEMNNLADFLGNEGDFKWWLLLGPAGSGKSRLALEAYISHGRKWTAGFLNTEFIENTHWNSWQPTAPTFIIIDYLPGREEPVHRMLLALSSRREPIRHPIRTLIIDRALDDTIEKIMGIGGDRARIQSKRFREKPIVLGRLSDRELLTIASESAIKGGRASVGATAIEHLQRSEAATPLLAALVGEGDLTSGASRDEFLSDYLHREEQSRWNPANVNPADKNLCALATMLDGINLEEFATLPRDGVDFPTVKTYRPERLSVMTGFKSTDEVRPLSPHLIGEFFVLERLSSLHKIARQALVRLMWRGFPRCYQFIYRCRQDFPQHEMTTLITEAPHSSSEQALDHSTLLLFPDFLKCSMQKNSWAKARTLLAAIDRVNGRPKTPLPSDKIRLNWQAQAHLYWAQCEAADGHPESAVQTVKEWAGHELDDIPKSRWALEPLFLMPVGEVLQELVKTFAANERWADSDKAFQSLLFMAEQCDVLDPTVCLTKCTIQAAFALENIAQVKSASQRYERLKGLEASADKKTWLFVSNKESVKESLKREFHARLELAVALAAKSVIALAGNEASLRKAAEEALQDLRRRTYGALSPEQIASVYVHSLILSDPKLQVLAEGTVPTRETTMSKILPELRKVCEECLSPSDRFHKLIASTMCLAQSAIAFLESDLRKATQSWYVATDALKDAESLGPRMHPESIWGAATLDLLTRTSSENMKNEFLRLSEAYWKAAEQTAGQKGIVNQSMMAIMTLHAGYGATLKSEGDPSFMQKLIDAHGRMAVLVRNRASSESSTDTA